jgi:hypothetical protein
MPPSTAEPGELPRHHVPAHRRLAADDTVEDNRVGLRHGDPLAVRRPVRVQAMERLRGAALEAAEVDKPDDVARDREGRAVVGREVQAGAVGRASLHTHTRRAHQASALVAVDSASLHEDGERAVDAPRELPDRSTGSRREKKRAQSSDLATSKNTIAARKAAVASAS